MELVQVGDKTYYLKNPTNIGIYKIDEENVYLIDSGNDSDAGKKILKIMGEQGWNIKGIIVTHSHADHIGGNKIIQDRTNCSIFAHNIEKSFTEFPELEPIFLYGSNPLKEMKNKFLMAKESKVTTIENHLPEGLEYISLKGHSFDMIGIKTKDNIYFIGDSLFSEETINKYHIFFLYNVKEYLNTLDKLNTLDGQLYIPSHGVPSKNITSLIEQNRNKIKEISDKIYNFCASKKTFEEILKYIFDDYNLKMNMNQYILVGSAIKSYLTYLQEENKITYEWKENIMFWKQNESVDI